jgi:hypothetical protein
VEGEGAREKRKEANKLRVEEVKEQQKRKRGGFHEEVI